MKNFVPLCCLLLGCIVTLATAIGILTAQEKELFTRTDPKARISDTEAIQAWWRELQGDGGPSLKVIEAKRAADPRQFEVKIDGDWVNCGKIAQLKSETSHAVIAKMQASGGGKTRTENRLFIIGSGEVLFSHDVWKKL